MLQDTGAVGHSFPGLSSYITRHYRFADMLAIKKEWAMQSFSAKAKQGTMWNMSSLMPYFTFVFHTDTTAFFFSILSLCLHHLTAGKVRATALAVAGTLPVRLAYAWWAAGWSEPSSSHFLSPWLHLPHFTPQRGHSGVGRSVQSSVFGMSSLLPICYYNFFQE